MLLKDDYKLYVKEEHTCHVINAITFFMLGVIAHQILRMIVHFR